MIFSLSGIDNPEYFQLALNSDDTVDGENGTRSSSENDRTPPLPPRAPVPPSSQVTIHDIY